MSRAIPPGAVAAERKYYIPDEVIQIFNDMIVENMSGRRATIYQEEVITRICENLAMDRYDVFQRNYLEIEDEFRAAGWKVTYDRPGYCESYKAHWIFERKQNV